MKKAQKVNFLSSSVWFCSLVQWSPDPTHLYSWSYGRHQSLQSFRTAPYNRLPFFYVFLLITIGIFFHHFSIVYAFFYSMSSLWYVDWKGKCFRRFGWVFACLWLCYLLNWGSWGICMGLESDGCFIWRVILFGTTFVTVRGCPPCSKAFLWLSWTHRWYLVRYRIIDLRHLQKIKIRHSCVCW